METYNHSSAYTMPNYGYVFEFEKNFDHQLTKEWMNQNWKQCFYYIGVYMCIIFGLQHFMQNRRKFELRKLLFLWNVFLALFSIIGTSRTMLEMVHVLTTYGFYHSACIPSSIEQNTVSGFWSYMFALSKVPELGDTVFVVLRKQPLIFLHWYHHVTVLMYTWYAFTEFAAPGRWFIFMNYLVHSLMYSYYALKACRIHVPRFVSISITIAQLSQMVIGCYVGMWSYMAKEAGLECKVSYDSLKVSFLMYLSYFLLFSQFFYNSYMKKPSSKYSVRSEKNE